MQTLWMIMMGDQRYKYLPITKLMHYWTMIRTILHPKIPKLNTNSYIMKISM